MIPTLHVLIVSAAAWCAAAQEAPEPATEPVADGVVEPAELELRGRRIDLRDELRETAPALVGLDVSKPGYRPDLPIADAPRTAPAQVDREALRERMLALYAGQRVTSVGDVVSAVPSVARGVGRAGTEARSGQDSFAWTACGAIALVVLVLLAMRLRRARAEHVDFERLAGLR